MLDNLRAMAIFASVVRHGSFSGTAKELNITTSAVSQQIRSLESDLGTVLLQRSTRKISLTEAGEIFYQSAINMVGAAQTGWHEVNRLRDEVTGSLTIATTPKMIEKHLMLALSDWLDEHESLSLNFMVKEDVDLSYDRVDVHVGLVTEKTPQSEYDLLLGQVSQVILASPDYLSAHDSIRNTSDLDKHKFITIDNDVTLDFAHHAPVKMNSRLNTNSSKIALDLALSNRGIIKINTLDAEPFVKDGKLIPVLDKLELPKLNLVAKTPAKEFQPIKVQKCLDVLARYFHNQSKSPTSNQSVLINE